MKEMINQLKAIIDKDLPLISNLANASSVINQLDNINWCGFYLNDGKRLVLGPFQGEVACSIIPYDKGVCGYAFTNKKTVIVDNVNEFPGHIACSSLSKSEIVVPIIVDNVVKGVIDVDAPIYSRFNEDDAEALEECALILTELFK